MSIADNIKQLRKQKQLTQKQLAERSGIAIITIQQYEAGKYNPKPDSIMKLCIGLDCKETDIVDDKYKIYYRMFENKNVSRFIGIDMDKIQDQDEVSRRLKIISDSFKILNSKGQKEAVKRIEELTEIPRYIEPDELSI